MILADIQDLADRYGCVILERQGAHLILSVGDVATAELLAREEITSRYLTRRIDPLHFEVEPAHREF